MMYKPVISVICPVYNTKMVLGKCIRSVIEQDYKDIEIILINDGSTDGSFRVCQKYARKDQRIKIIDKPNGGRTQARKDGVLQAQGEYIFFIDSDDYIEKKALSTLIKIAKKHNLDMVIGHHDIVFDNWGLVTKQYVPFDVTDRIIGRDELLRMFLRLDKTKNNFGGVYMWGRLYKSSCIFEALNKKEPFLFPPQKEMLSEDIAFNLSLVQYLKSGWMINDVLYHHRYGGSTSKYFPVFFRCGYYYDYRYELCVENGLQQYFPDMLSDYCNIAICDVGSRLHYKIGSTSDIQRLLLREFENRKITKWARLHSNEIPDIIKNNTIVQFLLNGDSATFFRKLDERERFLKRHHYWKMRIMSFYQKVVDAISYCISVY